jgi:hypothetical protein
MKSPSQLCTHMTRYKLMTMIVIQNERINHFHPYGWNCKSHGNGDEFEWIVKSWSQICTYDYKHLIIYVTINPWFWHIECGGLASGWSQEK